MRLILTILFFVSLNAGATNYYVSNAGSDLANGVTALTSWQTIAKVNAQSFVPGDSVLFKSGDTWNERLNPPSSGSAGNPITFASYSIGLKPRITGLQTITGWSNQGNNIWSAPYTSTVSNLNTVVINGTIGRKARYPNTAYLLTNAVSSTTVINTPLTGTPNFTGGEVAIGTQQYIIDVSDITAQSSGALTVSPAVSNTTFGNNSFCIQNLPVLCDVQGEWADSAGRLYVYATSSPTNVLISSIDTLVYMRSKNYITFDGLSFTGSNKLGIGFDSTSHISVINCKTDYSGGIAIQQSASTYSVIRMDSILNSLSVGIWTFYISHYAFIHGNYIKNSGKVWGMAASGNLTSMAMFAYGNNDTTSNNRIDSVGYIGIYFNGTNSLVENNYITNHGANKSDGGAIYTYGGLANGSKVRANICLNGLGGISGILQTPGIYLDELTTGVTVDSNSVSNNAIMNMFIHQANNCFIYDNTFFSVTERGIDYYPAASNNNIMDIRRNIVYVPDSTRANFYLDQYFATSSTYTIDSNYYMRPLKEDLKMKIAATTYSLSAWTGATGWDSHAYSTPSGITALAPLFLYNPSGTDSTFTFSGRYTNAKGLLYTGSAVIHPFKSETLFKTIAEPNYSFRIGTLKFQ